MLFPRPTLFALLCGLLLAPCLANARPASTYASVSGRLGLDGLSVQGRENHGVITEDLPITHPAFDRALRLTVPRRIDLIHQIQVNVPNRTAIAADEVILVRLTVRSGGAEGSRIEGKLFIQDRTAGHRSLGERPVEAGSAWEEIEFLVPLQKAYFRNEVSFALMLGGAAQTVDLARFEVWNLGPRPDDATLARLRAAAFLSHDFEGDYTPIPRTVGTASRVTGALPSGWEEDSAWADVTATYGAAESNPFAGEKSLRVEVASLRAGRVQFRIPHLVAIPDYQIRLRVATRSPTSTPVNVSLRQRGAPYRVYWETTLPAAPEWGLAEALASFPHTDPSAVLMFSLANPGVLELDQLSLTYLTPTQALGNRTFEGNLLPSSSFPLGLTAPWTPGGNGIPEGTYTPDPAMPGPSGLPSLRLKTFVDGRPVAQITAPFEGRPASPHTFSFWARADHTGHSAAIRVGPPAESLWLSPWQKTITLTEEWQRYHFTVTLPPSPDGFYLARLNTHESGTIWVDQLMIEASDQLSDFRPVSPVELTALATAPFGLGFEGESLPFTVAAHGDLASLHHVAVTVRDLYDQVRELPPLTAFTKSERHHTYTSALPALDLPPLGSFLLEFTARDADGRSLSKPAELLLHRVRPPRHLGREAPESAFGTHVFSTPSEAFMAKALGFNWVRLNYKLNWSRVEPRPGVWSWAGLDAEIATFRAQNLSIMGYLGGVPARASHAQPDWPRAWWRMTAAVREEHLDDWQEYARRVFERYGHTLAAFETWNEPFLPGFFPVEVRQGTPVRAPAPLFHQMTQRVRAAATAANLQVPLLWNMGAAYGPSELAFDQENVALGTAALVDGYTFHRYTNAPLAVPDDQFTRDTATLAATLGAPPPADHPFINSEGGSSNDLFNLYRHAPLAHLRARSDLQAANFVRYFLSNFAAGVQRVFIYAFFSVDDWVPRYSYLNLDGQLSAAAPALSQLAWQLEGLRFTRAISLLDAVHALHFEANTSPESVVVLNSLGHRPVSLLSLPPHTVATDLYGNPPSLPAPLGVGLLYLRGPDLTLEALTPHLFPR